MTSFLQYEGLAKPSCVKRVKRPRPTRQSAGELGSPRLIASVEGVRFYGH